VVGSVLVVAEQEDLHAEAVSAILRNEHRVDVVHVDTGAFPETVGSYRLCATECSHALGEIELQNVRSVWWRRPSLCRVPPSFRPSDDEFRQAECDGFIQGLLWSLPALWINHPGAERVASRKIVQLTAAKAAGLAVPDTLITNDPEQAAAFIDARGRPTIYKRTGTSRGEFSETRLIMPGDITRLDSIRLAPTTFQDYIDADSDLRVVWIAGQAWTVRIDSQSGAGSVDSRLDYTVDFTPYELPEPVKNSLNALMHNLGLAFGVVDLRVGRDEQIYFLEVNPQGQFAYLEVKTDLPIFRSLAKLLADPAHVNTST
jgi:hypothetical protein